MKNHKIANEERARCRIIVLISGRGTNLQALINEAPRLGFTIDLIISSKADACGLERARKHQIPFKILEHQFFDSREDFDQALSIIIDEKNPHLVVLAGFMRILGKNFVQHFHGRMLNIHPSLLPKYPGTNTHQRALDAGDAIHGVTVHFVTEDIDGGPIIAQESIKISPYDTGKTLAEKTLKIEHTLYPKIVNLFASGRLSMKDGEAWLDNKVISPKNNQFN
jgi:phosphoribosylglycinamide formyltransferase-1